MGATAIALQGSYRLQRRPSTWNVRFGSLCIHDGYICRSSDMPLKCVVLVLQENSERPIARRRIGFTPISISYSTGPIRTLESYFCSVENKEDDMRVGVKPIRVRANPAFRVRCYRSEFGSFLGRPPALVFRFAASSRKYSEPRLAIAEPPFRPSAFAAGERWCLRRSFTRASAECRSSRERPVRFCGRSGVVSRIRSTSAMMFLSASSSSRPATIHTRYGDARRIANSDESQSTHLSSDTTRHRQARINFGQRNFR